MSSRRRWQTYDVFKLIISVILVIILLLLFIRSNSQSETSPPSGVPEFTEAAKPTPTETATPMHTGMPTLIASPTWTPSPTASLTPTVTPSKTYTPTSTTTPDICSLALESRLGIGMVARVRTNLNFRVSPGIDQTLILTNIVNTRLEIIGGPVCTPYLNKAYMWWEVRRPDGSTGWSAEGSATSRNYFLEPDE